MDPDCHYPPLVLALAVCVASASQVYAAEVTQPNAHPIFKIQSLGMPANRIYDIRGFNDAGELSGHTEVVDPDPSLGTSDGRGFLWSHGKLVLLDGDDAHGINSKGEVVGEAYIGSDLHAVIWANGKRIDRGPLGYAYQAEYLDDQDEILGGACDVDDDKLYSFFSTGGDVSKAPRLGTGSVRCYALNSKGTVVYTEVLGVGPKAILQSSILKDGKVMHIGDFAVRGINDNDDIDCVELPNRPAIWRKGVLTQLGTPPRTEVLDMSTINNRGEVVGLILAEKKRRYASLWKDGQCYDLNTCIQPTGKKGRWTLERAAATNNLGQIVGEGIHNGKPTEFLLTPIEAKPVTNR